MSALCIAIIDDEPLFSEALAFRIGAAGVVHQFDRPRRLLDHGELAALTHAIVDLSFGPLDLDAPTLEPEAETGLDAVLTLEALAPDCRVVAVTTLGAPLSLGVARAIRQTRPDIVFLNKADRRLPDQINRFLTEGQAVDNAEFGRLLADVASVPRERIVSALEASTSHRSIRRLLLSLAEHPTEPTLAELEVDTGWRPQTIKNYLQELGTRLASGQVIDEPATGLALWGWARSRRSLLVAQLG
ncbi:MAG: ActR/RegA family two-component response regulator [Acidimicrobiales bacterium]|jgi:ActR/RegA family two-component response regulator